MESRIQTELKAITTQLLKLATTKKLPPWVNTIPEDTEENKQGKLSKLLENFWRDNVCVKKVIAKFPIQYIMVDLPCLMVCHVGTWGSV